MHTSLVHSGCRDLSVISEKRGIFQPSNQQIVIRWDQITVQLRPIDLCVLHGELESLMSQLTIEKDEDYLLSINEQLLYLTRADLSHFYEMVCDATEHIPCFVVRWKEVRLSLCPYDPRRVINNGSRHGISNLCIN